MDKTTAIIGIVIAVVVVGGLALFFMQPASPSVINTATTTPTTGGYVPPVTQASAPTVVTDANAAPTDTTAVVVGKTTPNGALTSYWYEYGTSANAVTSTPHQMIGSGFIGTAAPAYITGLTKSTTYYFRLVASNSFGTVKGTQYTFTTSVGTPAPVGGLPSATSQSATSVTKTSANLNGSVIPNKASTQYWFEYGKTSDLGNTTAFVSIGSGSAKVPVSASVANLDSDTTYYFRLNAQNEFGTVNGSILTFKTPASPVVSAPTTSTKAATGVTSSKATLHGTINPNNAVTLYWFEYSSDAQFAADASHSTNQVSLGAGAGLTSVAVPVTGLTASTTYYYRLAGQNTVGTLRGDRMTFTTN